MQKPSPHYRQDDWRGLDDKIRDYLDREYFHRLDNLNTTNPKLLVVFSGGNAMGKTTLTHKIKDELSGLAIETDGIKRALLARTPDLEPDQLNKLTWQYSMNLYSRLDSLTPNGLIVRDSIIDWYFDRILPIFEKANYPLFIIGFDVSRERAIELIKTRGDTPTTTVERLIKIFDDHVLHMHRFRSYHSPDVLLTDEIIFDHDYVVTALRAKLEQLKS